MNDKDEDYSDIIDEVERATIRELKLPREVFDYNESWEPFYHYYSGVSGFKVENGHVSVIALGYLTKFS